MVLAGIAMGLMIAGVVVGSAPLVFFAVVLSILSIF